MGKRNPMLEQLEAKYQLKYRLDFLRQMDILTQMAQDAAHRTLGMGPGRALPFTEEYRDCLQATARLAVDDGKDDNELWYTKAKDDEELLAIVGEKNFVPWEERYNFEKSLLKDAGSVVLLITLMDAAKEGRLVVMPTREAALALQKEVDHEA